MKQENADIDEEEKREYIQRTENEISRINTIIRQLLDLSRPSPVGVESISVHDVITDMTDVVKFQPLMSNIDIQLDLEASRDRVIADSNQLRQVFLNLILNAADAMKSNADNRSGCMFIRTSNRKEDIITESENRKGKECLNIEVIDNGLGIDEEHLGNIFDPFFSTKDPGKGTGLGLSVCFIIIDSIGGKITATSEHGKGTTMNLLLPLDVGSLE